MTPRALVLCGAACLALFGCSSGVAVTSAPSAAAPTEASPAPTVAPSTASPAAAAACVISTPQQVGADTSPVVIQYEGYGEERCAALLVVAADASDFAKANPPTRLSAPPTEAPVCTKTLAGVTLTVWGAAAAQVACAAMK